MILELEHWHDTDTPSHKHNERICETTPEETGRSVPPGAAGNRATGDPESPAERRRPPGEHPRSTPTHRRRQCRRGCASWPGSSPVPTWSGRLTGRRAKSRRSPALAYCQRRGCLVSTAPEDETVSVAGLCPVNEAAKQYYPTGRSREEASCSELPFQSQCGGRRRSGSAALQVGI